MRDGGDDILIQNAEPRNACETNLPKLGKQINSVGRRAFEQESHV